VRDATGQEVESVEFVHLCERDGVVRRVKALRGIAAALADAAAVAAQLPSRYVGLRGHNPIYINI